MKNQKVRNSELLRYGDYLKVNNFQTPLGYYTIRIIQYKGSVYFHKMKNGQVVEITRLT